MIYLEDLDLQGTDDIKKTNKRLLHFRVSLATTTHSKISVFNCNSDSIPHKKYKTYKTFRLIKSDMNRNREYVHSNMKLGARFYNGLVRKIPKICIVWPWEIFFI